MTVILRSQKGSPLTYGELDGNFQYLYGRTIHLSSELSSTNDKLVNEVNKIDLEKQDANSKLDSLVGLGWENNSVPFFTGSNNADKFTVSALSRGIIASGLGSAANLSASSFAQTFLNANTQAAQRTSLGFGAFSVNGVAASNNDLWVQSPSGMYGIGNTAALPVLASFNASPGTTNIGRWAGTTIGIPAGSAGSYISFLTHTADNGYSNTIAMSYAADRYSFGRRTNGGNMIWSEAWHINNLTPNKLGDRTLSTLPSASANLNQMFVCTDTPRGKRSVISDGTSWVKLEDNSLASEP